MDEVVVTVRTQVPPHVTSYAYDGDGNRVSQTIDGVTTAYAVNAVPKLADVLAETTNGATTTYVYGQDLLYSLTASGPHYHHTDALGSTIAVTDATGAVEQTFDYDVFGLLRSSTGAGATTRTFTGEENDSSGLEYLRARYYDPASGRFLSRDPYPMKASDTQTVNRYAYVKNNPMNYVDPSGEEFAMTLPGLPTVFATLSAAADYIATASATMAGVTAGISLTAVVPIAIIGAVLLPAENAGQQGETEPRAKTGEASTPSSDSTGNQSSPEPHGPGAGMQEQLIKLGIAAGGHLILRMLERGVSVDEVTSTLQNGTRYMDSVRLDTIAYVYNGVVVLTNALNGYVYNAWLGGLSSRYVPFT
ncbi:MAG: RHS repeat-associated core domain-containing protein [Thermoanaerobaculia bacterium]